jgi:8-oxo-dGTP pyrophosphatase MutT (NUDIX family)
LRTRFNAIRQDGSRGKLHEEPEWGIPKGRRDNKETDLQCAIREFQEETQLADNSITIYKNIMPLEEVYVGNNGIKYRHIYFIGELTQEIRPSYASVVESGSQIGTNGFSKNREISGVQIFGQPDALSILREHCVEKKKILQKAFYIINNVNYYFSRSPAKN